MPGPVLRVPCLAPFCGFLAWPRFAGSLPGPVLRVPCLAPFCGFLKEPTKRRGVPEGSEVLRVPQGTHKTTEGWDRPHKTKRVTTGSKILRVHGFYWKVLRVPQGTHKTKGGPRGVSRFTGSLGRTLKVLRVPQGTDKTGSSRNRQNQGGSQRGFSFCGFLGG
jgi:hypothetical protein